MQDPNKLHTWQEEIEDRDVETSLREGKWRVRKTDRIHLGYFGGGCCHRAGSNSLVLIIFFYILHFCSDL